MKVIITNLVNVTIRGEIILKYRIKIDSIISSFIKNYLMFEEKETHVKRGFRASKKFILFFAFAGYPRSVDKD